MYAGREERSLTLLSQDATARISWVGENAIFETDSGGGCDSSTSLVLGAAADENMVGECIKR